MKNKLLLLGAISTLGFTTTLHADSGTYNTNRGVRAKMATSSDVLNETSINDIKSLLKNTTRQVLEGNAAGLHDYIVTGVGSNTTAVTEKYINLKSDKLVDVSDAHKPFLSMWEKTFDESFYDSLDEHETKIKITNGYKSQLITHDGLVDIPLVKVPGAINNSYYINTSKSELELNESIAELSKEFASMDINTSTKTKLIEKVITRVISSIS